MLPGVNAAALVRGARRQVGLTQAQLAERVGTTQSAIARIETGASEPSLARVDMLVSACGRRLVIELEEAPGRGHRSIAPDALQARWDGAVRAANFVLAGRRAVATA
jgi:transcriptional regulator with XRE-family HTH domain